MKSTMTKVAAALALTVATTYAQATVVGPTDMRITSAKFGEGVFTGASTFPIAIVNSSLDITDQYNPAGWDTSVAQTTDVAASGAVLSFSFGTGPTDQANTFTAPSAGSISGGPAPVFNGLFENGNVSSINMTSFFANWGGSNFNQGNAAQRGNGNNPLVTNLTMSNCVAGISCEWSMSWKSNIIGGPFDGSKGTWSMSGTIAAVPEASTYGMMLAGLGLIGLMKRRRNLAKSNVR
jgi:hypothetical protein